MLPLPLAIVAPQTVLAPKDACCSTTSTQEFPEAILIAVLFIKHGKQAFHADVNWASAFS